MFKLGVIFSFLLCFITSAKTCANDWHKYENKCFYILDMLSTYKESLVYCKKSFKAGLLSINSEEDAIYWTFNLFRYLNFKDNIWLNSTSTFHAMSDETDDCLALKKLEEEHSRVGDIITTGCNSLGVTVCEKLIKTRQFKIPEVGRYDPNSDFVPNRKVKLLDGSDSEIFTGVYYEITSKFRERIFMNEITGNGKCSLGSIHDFDECESYFKDLEDTDVHQINGKLYMLTPTKNGETRAIQMQRFTSTKQIVSWNKQGLHTFMCYEDGYKSEVCDGILKKYKMNALWNLEPTKSKEFYRIRSNNESSVVGVIEFKQNYTNSTGFALYNQRNFENELNDKILFKFIMTNYEFNIHLYSVEFEKSLSDIIESSKKQMSLIETVIINNNSPASLNHEVSSEKQLIESFLASFGNSEKFLESFSSREEVLTSSTQSKSSSKSFTESASEALSLSLTNTLSTMISDTESSSSSSTSSHSLEAGFSAFGFSASYGFRSENTNSNTKEQTRANTKGSSQSSETNTVKEHASAKTHETSGSKTDTGSISDDRSKGNERMNEVSKQTTNTTTKTYRISKTVIVPPYSAVKISSYANWVDDISIQCKLNLKFTANSWRRRTDGKATNEWRALDANVVEYFMKIHDFPGIILYRDSDAVYGQITATLKASVGLDSVFSSKEIDFDEEN